ncbi:hypothetical protein SL003B_2368 [Polymorphum gilvum SL003B-26A1]|uniref:Uncharacterized protein n=1 Tax=Polymorphum gilvum (strain LMG 25793 / CGMCC 1.9160 / SL003B-26A1) TaxID=991905 RepID=F2J0V7_POLGS|nr:hypothetical protein SL003B_2368 [Polymorphum gilvum SL003B-26A1]
MPPSSSSGRIGRRQAIKLATLPFSGCVRTRKPNLPPPCHGPRSAAGSVILWSSGMPNPYIGLPGRLVAMSAFRAHDSSSRRQRPAGLATLQFLLMEVGGKGRPRDTHTVMIEH